MQGMTIKNELKYFDPSDAKFIMNSRDTYLLALEKVLREDESPSVTKLKSFSMENSWTY